MIKTYLKIYVSTPKLRYLLWWIIISLIFILSFPGNRSDADDGFGYAFQVRNLSFSELFLPRHLLFLPANKLFYIFLRSIGFEVDAFIMMCVISSVTCAAVIVLLYVFQRKILGIAKPGAVTGCLLLFLSYGFWRYAVEAEVYGPAYLIILVVIMLVCRSINTKKYTYLLLAAIAGGIGILFYKPSFIVLALAVSVIFILKQQWKNLVIYLSIAGLVVLAGYYLAYKSSSTHASSFIQYTFEAGYQRAPGSPVVSAFVVASNFVSPYFMYGIEPMVTLIRKLFPEYNITEEVFAGNKNGIFNYMAIVMLLGLIICFFILILAHFNKKLFKLKMPPDDVNWIFFTWIFFYSTFLLYSDPTSTEPWIMIILPVCLLFNSLVIWPYIMNIGQKLPLLMFSFMFLHNFFGGYLLIRKKESDYHRYMADKAAQMAAQNDLIISYGGKVVLEYIKYYNTKTNTSLIDVRNTERDFNQTIALIRLTLSKGNKVYLLDDVINPSLEAKFKSIKLYDSERNFVISNHQNIILLNPGDTHNEKLYTLTSVKDMEY